MYTSIYTFLRHIALTVHREPKELIEIFEILAKFLKDPSNFKNSTLSKQESTLEPGGKIVIPLVLSDASAEKLKSVLSEHPTVYSAGTSGFAKKNEKEVVVFPYLVGQFLSTTQILLDNIQYQIQESDHKLAKEIKEPVNKAYHKFMTAWRDISARPHAGALGQYYDSHHDTPNYAREDLLKRIEKGIPFLKDLLEPYEIFKKIPE